jgi:hypothetical protein
VRDASYWSLVLKPTRDDIGDGCRSLDRHVKWRPGLPSRTAGIRSIVGLRGKSNGL